MSIYELSGNDRKVYLSISDAMYRQKTRADIPNVSMDKLLLLYNKALSESENGILYKPGTVQVSGRFVSAVLNMEKCKEIYCGREVDSRIEKESDKIIYRAEKERTEYEKVLSVYRFFVDEYKYAWNSGSNIKYHLMASPFLYKEAVCEGFALAFSYIMNKIGISCGIVSGVSALDGDNDTHAWNVIRLGNNCYHIDVTWDICRKDRGRGIYDYFFLNDSIISRDHRWVDSSIPICTDESMEYYAKKNLLCSSVDDALELIKKQLKAKKKMIIFRLKRGFSNGYDVNDRLIQMLKQACEEIGSYYSHVTYGSNKMAGTGYYCIDY